MFNVSQLKSGLIGLVGWRQNYDPSGVQLSALTASSSGLYFNGEHPLLNIENLLSLAPEFDKITIPAWNSGTAYVAGNLVSLSGTNYRAIAASTNQTPPNATYWEVYDAFTEWLKEKTEAGIVRAITAWLNKKVVRQTGNSLLERKILFDNASRITELDSAGASLVGIEVIPRRRRGLQLNIERIGLQFDTNQNITVYLFHSQDAGPEQSQAIAYAGGGGLQWETVNWALSGEGAYYIVYDQAALAGQSINGVYDYGFANWDNIHYYPSGRYFQAVGFEAPAAASVSAMWDISGNAYTLATNYGLNLDINAQCDYTALILEQKNLFADLIAKQVAADLLRELAFNPTARINRHEANIDRESLLYEVDGDSRGYRPGGIRKQLEDAIEAIQLDATGLDSACLPCRRRAVRYTSV